MLHTLIRLKCDKMIQMQILILGEEKIGAVLLLLLIFFVRWKSWASKERIFGQRPRSCQTIISVCSRFKEIFETTLKYLLSIFTMKLWTLHQILNKYFRTGVLSLLVLAYPQIKIIPLCVPLSQSCFPFAYHKIKKIYLNELLLSSFLMLHTLCEHLLSDFLKRASHVLQVENHCFERLDRCWQKRSLIW